MTWTKASPSDSGCFVSSRWGHYAVARAVECAQEFGYGTAEHANAAGRPDLEEQQALIRLAGRHLRSMSSDGDDGLTGDEWETLMAAADDVENWLTEHAAPEGYSFGWSDGEFCLWPESQWRESGRYDL
jgi:hypothetical protein